nr:hypothetical protein [Pandoravirus belohorizontensis]
MGVDAAAAADRIRLPVEAIAVAAAVDAASVVVVAIAPASILIVVTGVVVVSKKGRWACGLFATVGKRPDKEKTQTDDRSSRDVCKEIERALPHRFIVPACTVDMPTRANDEKRVDFFLFQTNAFAAWKKPFPSPFFKHGRQKITERKKRDCFRRPRRGRTRPTKEGMSARKKKTQ